MGDYAIKEAVAKKALDKYSDLLMSYPNVVGLGLGLENGAEKRNGNYVVKVYVSKRPPIFRRRIPSELTITLSENPQHIAHVPTEIEEIGELELETA